MNMSDLSDQHAAVKTMMVMRQNSYRRRSISYNQMIIIIEEGSLVYDTFLLLLWWPKAYRTDYPLEG